MIAIHQVVPVLLGGDAVGGHTLQVRRLLRDLGIESEIFAEDVSPDLRGEVHYLGDFEEWSRRASGEVALLYHLAIGAGAGDYLLERPEPKVVDYHNITPADFYYDWDLKHAMIMQIGREQLARLAPLVALGIADSPYNEEELRAVGYGDTAVAPILVDLDAFEREVDVAALDRLETGKRSGGADWLFVGRVAPNKAHHDILKAFAVYRRLYDPAARLHLVGGPGPKSYVETLERYVAALGLGDAVELAGSVPGGELAAYYRTADVFVCLSEHEGFCIPLLEAMYHRVPVVAYASTAVPDTLGPGGLLLGEKGPATVAASVDRVLRDAELRRALVAAGTARLEDFRLERTRARWTEVIQTLADGRLARPGLG